MQSTASIDAETVDRIRENAKEAVIGETITEHAGMSQPERLILAKKRNGELNEDLLVALLANRQYREFIFGLAYMTDLDIRTVQRIFYDPGCEALRSPVRRRTSSRRISRPCSGTPRNAAGPRKSTRRNCSSSTRISASRTPCGPCASGACGPRNPTRQHPRHLRERVS
ncbi:MAG: DUF2336 domain-containing protein [Alphaproteobacteria bacterium]|nr:DUF2336 domain-containing protein [Alphaproteobacteria bacterium]